MTQTYSEKPASYFGNARVEIEPLLGPTAERVLEVGCGAGQTMHWLKQTGRAERGWGLELFESAALAAREHFEVVQVGDAEALIDSVFEGMQFDLILCLDVLEHMVDPWAFVRALRQLLAPGGRLVISVPNVRCLKVLLPLAFLGRWRYADDGILDRTHLRFFTREGALSMLSSTQWRVERCIGHRPAGSRLVMLHRMLLGLLPDLTAKQYLVAATGS